MFDRFRGRRLFLWRPDRRRFIKHNNGEAMTISQTIKALEKIKRRLGDVSVYIGTLHSDIPLTRVILEDSYPVPYPLLEIDLD